jgi:predicted FMN-binding regulatory protein PaiB
MKISELLGQRKAELEAAKSELRMMQAAFADMQKRAGEKTVEIIGIEARVEELEGLVKVSEGKSLTAESAEHTEKN